MFRFNSNFGTLGLLDWLHGTDKGFHDTVQSKRHRTLWSLRPISALFPDKPKKDKSKQVNGNEDSGLNAQKCKDNNDGKQTTDINGGKFVNGCNDNAKMN